MASTPRKNKQSFLGRIGSAISDAARAVRDAVLGRKKEAKRAKTAKLKSVRSDLAELKRKGLYEGDARRAKGNSYQRSVIKKFSNVLDGTAKVVKVDKATAANIKSSGGRAAHSRAVIEVASKGEKIHFDKKRKLITGRRQQYGAQISRRIYFQKVFDPDKLPRPGKKQTWYYRVNFAPSQEKLGKTQRFDSVDALRDYMNTYKQMESPKRATREKFQKFYTSMVEIEEIEGAPGLDDEEDEE